MIAAILIVAVLLLLGLVARQQTDWFAAARIPVSLIAGVIGLIIWQILKMSDFIRMLFGPDRIADWESGPIATLQTWPGWLIAVVFAGMLLTKTRSKRGGGGFRSVAREGLMVWIIVIGQTTIGLWLTWLWIGPYFGLPNSTAMLIETGFAGGHGTAAAMGAVFENPTIGLDEGLDLGILMATAGLVYGLVAGMVCVNVGVWRRWTASPSIPLLRVDRGASGPLQSQTNASDQCADATPTASSAAKVGEAIEPLLLQGVWLAIAVGIGIGLQTLVGITADRIDASGAPRSPDPINAVADHHVDSLGAIDEVDEGKNVLRSRLNVAGVVGSFPLFIYTLFGGAIVRWSVGCFGGDKHGEDGWIVSDSIQRLTNASMDLLVVAAVMTLDLRAAAALWQALAILLVGGMVWSTFCLLVLSKRILPASHWFELGLINFGMSTGTTATGFVLLRVVDPHLRTRAAEEYALAAPLSAPFIGGGILTVGLPLLLFERIPMAVSTVGFTMILSGLIVTAVIWSRRMDAPG